MQRSHPDPVGTLEELQKEGLDPSKYGSCAARVSSGNGPPTIMGCAFHSPNRKGVAKCTLPCKNKGPENLKVRTAKRNGRRLEREMPCFFWYRNSYPENKIENGNISRIVAIAKEGERITYVAKETVMKKWVDNNNTVKVTHEPTTVVREIKPFPRPKDNPALSEDMHDERIREQDENERMAASWDERMGHEVKSEFMGDDFMGKPDGDDASESGS
jgi:hypothetical protein